MQSVLQYRRFRAAAKAQLERDQEKARRVGQHDSPRRDDPRHSPSSTTSDESKVDVEKGQDFNAPTAPRQRPHVAEPGEVDPSLGQAPPQQEKETMAKSQRPGDYQRQEPSDVEPAEEQEQEQVDDDDDDDDDHELRHSMRMTLSRTTTQQSVGAVLETVLTGINIRKRTTREGGDGNVFVVGYEGDNDPNNPHNWSTLVRIRCTLLIACIGCVVGFASSIDSSALPEAAEEFGVSEVVESMATGLFLIGFGFGSLVAGPISETVGRNPVYIVTLCIYMIFIMASALAPNIGAQLVFRFIAGIFGATPLVVAGGSLSDVWDSMERVYTFPIFANAAFSGPLLGPVVGGFIAQSDVVSWRWVEWTTLIFSGVVTILVVFFQPETFPPILLKWKAEHFRELTGDQRYRGQVEIREESLPYRLKRALYRPFVLTAREPIVILVALYLSIVYIVLFTFLEGYTFIFTDTYGISQGITGLCFLGIIIGLCGASALVPVIYKWAKRDLKIIQEQGGDRLPPEFRLWFSMLGGAFAIPISLFWMGWTARPEISIWSPLAASVLFGYGILCIFITCYQYIIDSYETFAASALASITFIRYVVAGGMTIAGVPFYSNVGVPYTLTIMGCLGAILVPVPYVFYKYGHWIRSKSKYAAAGGL